MVSRMIKTEQAPTNDETKCLYPGNSKLKMCCKNGMEIISNNIIMAIERIIRKAQFLSVMTLKTDLVLERLVKIRNTFPITNEENAMALTSSSVCPS